MKMRVGERVILARPSAEVGRFGIREDMFGKEFMVTGLHAAGGLIQGHGQLYTVYSDMVDPVAPLTPFELQVNEYIRRELNP